jgi:hypothetical protein
LPVITDLLRVRRPAAGHAHPSAEPDEQFQPFAGADGVAGRADGPFSRALPRGVQSAERGTDLCTRPPEATVEPVPASQ